MCVQILQVSSIRYISQEKGVKGASVLVAHKHFNLCAGAVIDVMHCVFLGIISWVFGWIAVIEQLPTEGKHLYI